jgi:hypothetical protein
VSSRSQCEICKGEGWVCENHREIAWGGGNATCCKNEGKKFDCGAGEPCKCNPMVHHGFVEVFSEVDEKLEVLH